MVRWFLSLKERYSWLDWPPLFLYVVVFVAFLARSFVFLDPDFGWHLAAGDYFVHHGFPATDIFTYTASNFPWVSHEWLNDIFVYFTYSIGGFPLLAVVFAALWMIAVWLITRKKHTMLVLLAVLAVLPFSGVRTLTWSVLLLGFVVQLLQSKRHYMSFLLPIIFLIWANLHGSFVVGFIYLMYQAIRKRSVKLGVITIVCIAISFINPYGYRLYGEIISTLTDPALRGRIGEWSAFAFPAAALPYIIVWVAVTFYAIRPKWRQWREYVRIDILFFIASISQIRQLPLFVIVSFPYTVLGVKHIADIIPKDLDAPRRRFVTIVAVAFGVMTLACAVWTFHGTVVQREAPYPQNIAAYLVQHPCDGRVFNAYNFGGYLIWKVPGEKVYIDGRMPSWSYRGQKYMDNYIRFTTDENYRKGQIKEYGITCAVLETSSTDMIQSFKKNGWHVQAKDTNAVLLEKNP